METRYSRQTILSEIGEEGQKRLGEARVLIVGSGGLGSPVALYLAGAGVGHITLCDGDTVSTSNLQRQVLYDSSMEGKPKAEMAAKRLHSLNPEIEVRAVGESFTESNSEDLVSDCDLVIDCTDNFATRFLIDDVCRKTGKPWIFGAIGEFTGHVSLLGSSSGRYLSDLYPDRSALTEHTRSMAGVIGPIPGVTGSLQAMEAMKVICNFGERLDGRLLVINFLTLETHIIDL